MKFNPFTPGKRLTRPDIFAGRTDQLESGVRLLARAAHGNVRHGLITGDRGIGKSSLASQIGAIAAGDEAASLLAKSLLNGSRFNFLVAEHISQRGEGVPEIVASLLKGLDRARNKRSLPITWELEFDLKLVKGRVGGDREEPRHATNHFIDQVEKAWSASQGRVDGILLVIDEVDRVAEEQGVPTFFKVATELMSARGIENVILLPVGMIGVQDLLKAEHASVSRVLETIHVPSLSKGESMDIVERALDGTGVEVKRDVNAEIARYAGGFPHPVHLIGSECFEADEDDFIDEIDLSAAIHMIVTEKWKEEFDSNYVAAGSGKYRDIIKAMAQYPHPNVPVQYICDVLNVDQPEISSNLNVLMKRDVIVRPDRGIYAFRDPLFRQYVSTMNVFGGEPVEQRPRKRPRKGS